MMSCEYLRLTHSVSHLKVFNDVGVVLLRNTGQKSDV